MPKDNPSLFHGSQPPPTPDALPEAAPNQLPPALQAGWQAEKQYYTIGEVAQLFDLRASNIRFWTTEFKLRIRTNRKGDRLYTGAQIQTIRAIYYLVKEKGYTLSGAKAKLREMKQAALPAGQQGTTDKNTEMPTVSEQARPIIYTLELQQSLLQLRNRLIQLRNQLT